MDDLANKINIERSHISIQGDDNLIIGDPENSEVRIKIRGNGNRIEIGQSFATKNLLIDIRGNNSHVLIGDNCHFTGTLRVRRASQIIIGSKTTSKNTVLLAHEERRIVIGEDCMFSTGVTLRTTDGHSIIDLKSGKRKNPAKDIVLKDHVWLGMNSIIAPGAEIASGCIIAMGAVVTKSFLKPNCTIGGVPAKILSKNISWQRELL